MEQTFFAVAPRWHSAGQYTLLCAQGGEARHHAGHSAAHFWHIKRQPSFVSAVMTVIVAVAIAVAAAIANAIANAAFVVPTIAVAVAVSHCRCRCCQPLLLLSISVAIAVAIAVALRLSLAITVAILSAIAVAVAISHGRCRCRRPLPLSSPSLSPLPLLLKQFKQIMLSLFYLVWAVSRALIAADDWPGVRWQWALANTSIGRRAASNQRLVGASG